MKADIFSETIAAFHLKVDRCRQLIEFMQVSGYSRSRSFLDLGSMSFIYGKISAVTQQQKANSIFPLEVN